MKATKIIFVSGLLVLAGWTIFRVRSKDDVNTSAASVPAQQSLKTAAATPANKAWVSPVPNDRDPEYTYRSLKADEQGDHEFQGRAPISFFGRVVDQDDQPLAGALIEFSWTDLSAKGTSQATTSSGGAGLFELLGRTGKYLSVKVQKDGYYPYRDFSWNSYEFGSPFSRHFPDKNAPVLFRLKKQGTLEPLVTWSAGLRPTPDGKKLDFQFLPDGQVVAEGGDIQVSCAVEPEDENRRYGWAVKVSIPGGGFLKTDEEFQFLAPPDGYVETLEWSMKADDPEWKAGTKTEDYYIRFGNPVRYGRVRIGFYANRVKFYKFSNFGLSYWINPSGSRVLEAGKREPPSLPETRLQNRRP